MVGALLLRAGGGLACLLLLCAPLAGAHERSLDDGVLYELNLARTQPQAYARALRAAANQTRASGAYDDPRAFEEAVDFLMRQPALPPLGSDSALEGSALAHADYQGARGGFGHEGPGGESLDQRLHRHGAFAMMMAEDISYGYANPREVVLQLIVDSGVPSRGHRANIFNPVFREAGVACGPHRLYGAMCVVDFAGKMVRR
jgi:uncharacterized protein YkwD